MIRLFTTNTKSILDRLHNDATNNPGKPKTRFLSRYGVTAHLSVGPGRYSFGISTKESQRPPTMEQWYAITGYLELPCSLPKPTLLCDGKLNYLLTTGIK